MLNIDGDLVGQELSPIGADQVVVLSLDAAGGH